VWASADQAVVTGLAQRACPLQTPGSAATRATSHDGDPFAWAVRLGGERAGLSALGCRLGKIGSLEPETLEQAS